MLAGLYASIPSAMLGEFPSAAPAFSTQPGLPQRVAVHVEVIDDGAASSATASPLTAALASAHSAIRAIICVCLRAPLCLHNGVRARRNQSGLAVCG